MGFVESRTAGVKSGGADWLLHSFAPLEWLPRHEGNVRAVLSLVATMDFYPLSFPQ